MIICNTPILNTLSHRLIRRLPVPGEYPGALRPCQQEVLARVDRRVRRVVRSQLFKQDQFV